MRILLCILLVILAAPTGADPKPKTVAKNLFRPQFSTTTGTLEAGTASCVKLNGVSRPITLTALHLFGPAGGLPKDLKASQLSTAVKGYSLSPIATGNPVKGGANSVITLPASAGDVVALWCPQGSKVKPFTVGRPPKKGDPVWLAAQAAGGAPANQLLHRAVYRGKTEGMLLFTYDNPKLNLRATSGAPILNSAGKVIGINYGGGSDNGRLDGYATPVSQFVRALMSAARKRTK